MKKLYKNILLASDLTDSGEKVALKALELAKQYDATMHIVHAYESLPVYAYGVYEIEGIESKLTSHAQGILTKLCKKLHIPSERQYLENQPGKMAILSIAEKIEADLIIVGSHSKEGLFSTLGSTSAAIVNNARCDVLVIRQGKD